MRNPARDLLDDLLVLTLGLFFRILLTGKTLWVKDYNNPAARLYAGRIDRVCLKRPAGRPEIVASCSTSLTDDPSRRETREFILTAGIHRIDNDTWGIEQ